MPDLSDASFFLELEGALKLSAMGDRTRAERLRQLLADLKSSHIFDVPPAAVQAPPVEPEISGSLRR